MAVNATPLFRRLVHLVRPPEAEPVTDAALLERFVRDRDETAFAALVARHGAMVLRVCRRVLADPGAADDAFQATLLVLARSAGAIRRRDALAAWLHGVAFRIARKARATAARHRAEPLPADVPMANADPDPLSELTARELLAAIDDEIGRLSKPHRLAVLLCCVEGLSQEVAAQRLGWTPGSLKGRLERGRKRLHARLVKRGLTLAALVALEVPASVSAAGLLRSARAVLDFTDGQIASGISVRAADLANEALKAAAGFNLKVVAALALSLCLAAMAAGTLTAPAGPDVGTPTAFQTPEHGEVLPRRALLIGIGSYLYLNPVHEGSPRSQNFPGSSSASLAATIATPPLRISKAQIFQLADGGAQPHPAALSVLKAAIQDFLDTSRAQDRIVIVFAGHATEIGESPYLIPSAGRSNDPATLLPLTWVYTQMAKCKARQKVLILDAFRFPPALGFTLPGAGANEDEEMGAAFDKALQNPPAGVQVWSSCIKGQRSIEFEHGSVFLQALNHALQRGSPMTGPSDGKTPLSLDEALVRQVNARIKELLGPEKFEQTSRLCGRPPADGAAYDPAEPPPAPITLKQPVTPGGPWASYAEIDSILSEIRPMRPARPGGAAAQRVLQAVNLPRLPAKALIAYRPDDYNTLDELLKRHRQNREAFARQRPIRAVVLDAMEALRKNDDMDMLAALSAPIDAQVRAALLEQQKLPGEMIFELEQVLSELRNVGEADLAKEASQRWRANFDYSMAQVESRLVHLCEYSFLLGQVRREDLPQLAQWQSGWRIASRPKIQVPEGKARAYAREAAARWQQIQQDYPDTPWAVLAHRESLIARGLEWRAKRE